MTVEARLRALEAFQSEVEGWHLPGKLNKLAGEIVAMGAGLDLHHAEIADLQARVALLEARLGDPQTVPAT